MRRGVLLLLGLIAGNVWGVIWWPKPARGDPRRQGLQCFAAKLLAQTKPRDALLVVLPSREADGGLVNHRLRYALPGRYVSTNLDLAASTPRPDWIATWRNGCDGVLERAGRR